MSTHEAIRTRGNPFVLHAPIVPSARRSTIANPSNASCYGRFWAIKLYTQSMKADPKSAPAFLNPGLLLNSPKAGDAALGTAIKLDPSLASRILTTTATTVPTTLAP